MTRVEVHHTSLGEQRRHVFNLTHARPHLVRKKLPETALQTFIYLDKADVGEIENEEEGADFDDGVVSDCIAYTHM